MVSSDNLIGQGADETHQTVDRCEVVLIGDLFYDTEIAADLHPWIQRLARAGAEVSEDMSSVPVISGAIYCNAKDCGSLCSGESEGANISSHYFASFSVQIYIGDPGRHGITETGVLSQMELRARYELPANVCLENSGFSHANVWQFRLPSDEA